MNKTIGCILENIPIRLNSYIISSQNKTNPHSSEGPLLKKSFWFAFIWLIPTKQCQNRIHIYDFFLSNVCFSKWWCNKGNCHSSVWTLYLLPGALQYSIQYTLYCTQFTVYCILYTIYSIKYSVYGIQYTLYRLQYTSYSIQYTLYSILYTVYIIQYTVYIIQ